MYCKPVFRELIIEISWPSKIILVILTVHGPGISNHRREIPKVIFVPSIADTDIEVHENAYKHT